MANYLLLTPNCLLRVAYCVLRTAYSLLLRYVSDRGDGVADVTMQLCDSISFRFWRFEDDRLCRDVVGDVSKLLPTQVVMAFYEAVSGVPSSSPWARGGADRPDAGAAGRPASRLSSSSPGMS